MAHAWHDVLRAALAATMCVHIRIHILAPVQALRMAYTHRGLPLLLLLLAYVDIYTIIHIIVHKTAETFLTKYSSS